MNKFLFIICILLLVVNVVGFTIFNTTELPVSLQQLLKRMEDAPTIQFTLDESLEVFKITADWGLLNGLRDLINVMGGMLGFTVWLATQLINAVICIGYLLYVLGFTSLQNSGIIA